MSNVRTKAKPKKAENPILVTRVLVEDLVRGDRIATMLREDSKYGVVATRTDRVEDISECPGQWRTHVHVNKKHCYDMRATIQVAL